MDFFKRKDLIVIILLIGLGFLTAGIYLQATNIYKVAFNSMARLAGLNSEPAPAVDLSARTVLAWAGVPVYDDAQRLTFDSSDTVSYRAKASAPEIAAFYGQLLADRGWEEVENTGQQLTFLRGNDELSIALAENLFSGKTKITYAFEPSSAVLGIKLAQEVLPPPTTPPLGETPPSDSAGCTPPPAGCGAGQYWDSGRCMCAGSGDTSSWSGGANSPSSCTDGQIWCANSSGSGGWCQMPPCPTQTNQQNQQQQPYQNNQQNSNQQPNQQNQQNQQMQQPFNQQTDTCRVNGVEMPGPCSNYNQQGQQQMGPNNQKFGPGGEGMGQQGQMGQQGPSEEEMKKMDEQRFKQMKQGLSQFSKGTVMMKKSVEKMRKASAKCGVGIPVELDNALKATDGLVKKIQDAKTADELEDIIGDVEDVGMTMQEWGPRMGDLNRLCQMMRQGDRDMKRLERDAKNIEKRVKANKKLDLTEILNKFKGDIASIKGVFLGVVTLAKTDPAAALEKLEDEFYGEMDNIRNSQMAIETAINVTQGLRTAASGIKKVESQIKSLRKKKVDTSEVEGLLATMKSQIAELQQLVKGKFEAEELIAIVEDAYATRQELQEKMQELQGTNTYLPSIKMDTRSNVNFQLPDAFRRQEINSGGEEIMGGGRVDESNPSPAP